MAYNALGLPALDTKGPDIVGAFSRGRELQNLSTRNALMQEELRGMPEKRQRETERFEHEKGGWDLDKKTKILDFDLKATGYVRESLAGIRFEEYPQFLQNLKDKGLDTRRFPESFDNPDQFELFRSKAIQTAREREIELQAKLNAQESEKGRTFQAGESEKTRTFQAGESAKTRGFQAGESEKARTHAEAMRPLVSTEQGFKRPEEAEGLLPWKDPRDIKLTEDQKFKIQMLHKEGEGLVKTIQDYRAKKVDEVTGKPKVTPEQAAEAVRRFKAIQSEVEAVAGQSRVGQANPNALAQPQGATTPAIGDQVTAPTTQQPTEPAPQSKAGSWRDYQTKPGDAAQPEQLGTPQRASQIYGYEIRDPFPKEQEYFQANPTVTGMAAEDGKITLNPFSTLSDEEKGAVAQNEAVRLWMKETNVVPKFQLTPEQKEAFKGTPYENDELSAKRSIAARIISGDPSAGAVTPEQQQFADWAKRRLEQKGSGPPEAPPTEPSGVTAPVQSFVNALNKLPGAFLESRNPPPEPEAGTNALAVPPPPSAQAKQGESKESSIKMPDPRTLPFDFMTVGGQFFVKSPGEEKFRTPTKEELALLKGKK